MANEGGAVALEKRFLHLRTLSIRCAWGREIPGKNGELCYLSWNSKGDKMTEYHPPMTGVESEFEEQLDPQHRSPDHQLERELRVRDTRQPSQESPEERQIEEAMHLDQ